MTSYSKLLATMFKENNLHVYQTNIYPRFYHFFYNWTSSIDTFTHLEVEKLSASEVKNTNANYQNIPESNLDKICTKRGKEYFYVSYGSYAKKMTSTYSFGIICSQKKMVELE